MQKKKTHNMTQITLISIICLDWIDTPTIFIEDPDPIKQRRNVLGYTQFPH